MTGEFGVTSWGRAWLRLAEPTSVTRPDPALPRARSLARNDRVRDVDLIPGRVLAVVDEQRPRTVRVTVPVWNESQLATARAVLARYGPGEDLPDTAHAALSQAALPMSPEQGPPAASCSCAGRKSPCPHILATYLDLARRLDERPRFALRLHGLTGTHTTEAPARIPVALVDPAAFYGPS